MAEKAQIEVWVVLDANGDYAIAKDLDDLASAYDTDIGSDAGLARRVIKLTVEAELPVTTELSGTAPHSPGKAKLTVA